MFRILTEVPVDPISAGEKFDNFVQSIKDNPVLTTVVIVTTVLLVSVIVLFIRTRKKRKKR